MLLSPVHGGQSGEPLGIPGQPDLHSDFWDSQNYITETMYQKIKQKQEQMRGFICIYL